MPIGQEVTEVRANHRFDEAALEKYLTEKMPGFRGPLEVVQFAGGQSNPTFKLRSPPTPQEGSPTRTIFSRVEDSFLQYVLPNPC